MKIGKFEIFVHSYRLIWNTNLGCFIENGITNKGFHLTENFLKSMFASWEKWMGSWLISQPVF